MELCVRKTPAGLAPVRDQDLEWYESAGNDEHYLGNLKKLRNPRFFRKWWAMVNFAFEHWEPKGVETKYGTPEKNLDRFRKDLTILAGYYDVTYKIDGTPVLTAQSISWGNMDEEEFHKFYRATFNAISKHIFSHYTPEQLREVEQALFNFC